MTAEKDKRVIEGPFAFDLKGDSHKIRIGISISPLPVLFMDKAIQQGFFANRSDFISQAVNYYIRYLKNEIDIEKLLTGDVIRFYEFMWSQATVEKEEEDSEVTGE